nr:unnamed protein product [Callosobruchus chinensis]
MWRTVDCRRRLPALCELYPERPADRPDLTYVDCGGIKNNGKKRRCVEQQKLYEIYRNSSRIDKCALENGLFIE